MLKLVHDRPARRRRQPDRPSPIARPGGLVDLVDARPMEAAATALALVALARPDKPLLWVQDRLSRLERGQPCLAGIEALLGFRPEILTVSARRPADALWAMEEGASCRALAGILGEVYGAPAVLDFTATKRLNLRAQGSGLPIILIRSEPGRLSVAERWRAGSAPSAAHPDDMRAPGEARWEAELFRAKGRPPGRWIAAYDRTTSRLDMAAAFRDGALDESGAPHEERAAR